MCLGGERNQRDPRMVSGREHSVFLDSLQRAPLRKGRGLELGRGPALRLRSQRGPGDLRALS